MSITTNSQDLTEAAFEQLDDMIREVEGQELVSQSRCVDQLLDLLNIAGNATVRDAIIEVLDDIRQLSSVRADDMVARYGLLGAIIDLESTVEV